MGGISPVRAIGAALMLSSFLTGCGKTYYETGTVYWGSSNPMVTTASVRTILQRPSNFDEATGLNRPTTIVCAEPSPDVAVAVGSAFGGSLSADLREGLNSPTGATPTQVGVAAAISNSRAEALAQLGERLATMQLLRDGLFRACEAFANGAISASTYSVMVSRIDDLVVTLLAEEMAAGAFGRSLAGASTGAASSSMATMLRQANEAAQKKLEELKTAEASENEAKLKLAKAEQDKAAGAATAPTEAEMTSLKADAKTKTEARQKAQAELNAAGEMLNLTLTAQADSEAWGAVTTGGKIEGRSGTVDANAIEKIAANYINDQGIDALTIACVSELSRMRYEKNHSGYYAGPVSELGVKCRENTGPFFALVGLSLLKGADATETDLANFTDLLKAQTDLAGAPARQRPEGPATLIQAADVNP